MGVFELAFAAIKMADLEYVRSVHGILTVLITVFTGIAMCVGHFVWDSYSFVFLIWFRGWPLVTMVLVFLFVVWFLSLCFILTQSLGKNLIVDLGKMKIMVVHAVCAVLLLACAIAESYYVHRVHKDVFYSYYTRFIIVMILCWAAFVCQVLQVVYIVLRG